MFKTTITIIAKSLLLIGLCCFALVQCAPEQQQQSRPRITVSDAIVREFDKLYDIREKIHENVWHSDDTEELLELLSNALKVYNKLDDYSKLGVYFVQNEIQVLSELIEDNLNDNCAHNRLLYRAKWTRNFDDFPKLKAFVAELNEDYYENCKQNLVIHVAKQIVQLEATIGDLAQLRNLLANEIGRVQASTTECNLFERCHNRDLMIRALLNYIEPRMSNTPDLLIFQDWRKYRNLFLQHLIDLQHNVCEQIESKLMQSYEDFELFLRPNEQLFSGLQAEIVTWMQYTNICHQLGLLEHHKLINTHVIERVNFKEVRERIVTDSVDVLPPQMTHNLLVLMSIFRSNVPKLSSEKSPHSRLFEDSADLADQADFRSKCSYLSVKKFIELRDKYAKLYPNLEVYFAHFADELVRFCRINIIRDIKSIIESKMSRKAQDKLNEIRRQIELAQINAATPAVELYRNVGDRCFVEGLAKYLSTTRRIKVKATDKPYDKDIINLEKKVQEELGGDCDLLRENVMPRGLDFSELVKLDRNDGPASLFDQFTRDWMANLNICTKYHGKTFNSRDLYGNMSKRGGIISCFSGGCFMS